MWLEQRESGGEEHKRAGGESQKLGFYSVMETMRAVSRGGFLWLL